VVYNSGVWLACVTREEAGFQEQDATVIISIMRITRRDDVRIHADADGLLSQETPGTAYVDGRQVQ